MFWVSLREKQTSCKFIKGPYGTTVMSVRTIERETTTLSFIANLHHDSMLNYTVST